MCPTPPSTTTSTTALPSQEGSRQQRNNSNSSRKKNIGIHWFRKGLRLHDNPALLTLLRLQQQKGRNRRHSRFFDKIYPVYVLDGNCYQLLRCTPLQANFLIECLKDLDSSLRKLGSRLYVLEGDPTMVLPQKWKEWNATHMSYENDETGEPYATTRDESIQKQAKLVGIELITRASETLHPLRDYYLPRGANTSTNKEQKQQQQQQEGVVVPNTMTGFTNLFFQKMPNLKEILPAPTRNDFPPLNIDNNNYDNNDDDDDKDLFLPPKKPTDLPWPRGIPKSKVKPLWGPQDCSADKLGNSIVHGGETLALVALKESLKDADWVATFEKPETSCTTLQPSTTCLSPYLAWGCLSPRQVWFAIEEAISRTTISNKKKHSKPPQSLHGQMLWRDFNHLLAHDANKTLPGCWNKMVGNKYCRQIPWDTYNPQLVEAWKTGQTGYPWIDACMRQLAQEGWIHHLGRHAVACFLTRGDLWQSWEVGAKHFESHLLDADYAINGFNWLWVSCSGFFYKYERCYSPIAFQKKKDPKGIYIRKFCPELKRLPNKYIYTPFDAPISVLERAGVKLGTNYPYPLVDHAVVRGENIERIKQAYAVHSIQQQRQRQPQRSLPSTVHPPVEAVATSTNRSKRQELPAQQKQQLAKVAGTKPLERTRNNNREPVGIGTTTGRQPQRPAGGNNKVVHNDGRSSSNFEKDSWTSSIPPPTAATPTTTTVDPKLAKIQALLQAERERDHALTDRRTNSSSNNRSNHHDNKRRKQRKKSNGLDSRHLYL